MEPKSLQPLNVTHILCNIFTTQCLIQLTAHVTISICYFVMHLNVLPAAGNFNDSHLQRAAFVVNAVQDTPM